MSTEEAEREIPAADREQAIRSLANLLRSFLPGTKLLVRIGRQQKERSDLQNRALWGCAYKALQRQTGNDVEDLHTFFCGAFWGWKTETIMGEKRRKPRRTTTKNEEGKRDVVGTMVMAEFYEFIQRRAAENGYDVPDPDPAWFEQREKAA